ncbi:aminotransferase class I/II-fold pyridoxal phosphate-dependent enzyme [Halarchaeum sp. P4]|uniref:aminotransferase class I/II-fold pyridoxal phosphate-dependent enzyme n=1 Tax=Halarchaeum sp. P4 TaxID=3421639 RepID=UPI003EC12C41
MDPLPPFELERWFAEYEHDADLMLAESGVRPLEAARFDYGAGELGYVIPTDGDPAFRERVAEEHGRTREEVLFTCGTQEANYLGLQAILEDGGHAVVVTPTYEALHRIPESMADVTEVPLSGPDWTLDVEAVRDAIRDDTRVVVLNNPNNPTGSYADWETVEELYDVATDAGAYLYCDEVYRELADDPHPPVATLGPNAVSTASVSKAYGLAGLRFGWLVGPEAVVERAWELKDYTSISVGKLDQHVAEQAITRKADILAENRAHVERNRERVADFLDEHGLDWHDPVGPNGFVTVPEGYTGSRDFCRTVVEEASVVLAPGDCFGYNDYFRIGFGLPSDELEAGLTRVADVLAADH